ncbi:MAG: hypothetical protein KF824_02135 [Fimbriimonadaceae bacterium]|nr:MAG: hypothetical protein KF824_02135 [Fimbriimonadaceae bacterium]
MRIQTMVVTIGDELGITTNDLTLWRLLVIKQLGVDMMPSDPDLKQYSNAYDEEFQMAFRISELWNSAWERDESDLVQAVRAELGSTIEEKYFMAFERAASKIHPLRTTES